MPTNEKNQEQAVALLLQNVRMPLFLNKLAQDHGIVANDEAEATKLLQLGSQLRAMYEQQKAAAGQQQGSLIDKALAKAAALSGEPVQQPSDGVTKELVALSKQAADVPEYRDAALTYLQLLNSATA